MFLGAKHCLFWVHSHCETTQVTTIDKITLEDFVNKTKGQFGKHGKICGNQMGPD